MEKEIRIPIPKTDKAIYGILSEVDETAPLVIMVPGLSSHNQEHQFYNGARALSKAGLNSFRMNLYGWEKDARDLIDCTLEVHVADLDLVIDHFNVGSSGRPIFVVGHSYGGLATLMSSSPHIAGAVLWDPTHKVYRSLNQKYPGYEYLSYEHASQEIYFMRKGAGSLLGKAMMDESEHVNSDDHLKNFKPPTKVILAGEGVLKDVWPESIKKYRPEVEQVVIKGAGHNFYEENTAQELYRETIDWIKKQVE